MRQLETNILATLRRNGRWSYIRHGVAGYMRKRIAKEHRIAYHAGFCDGYEKGKVDALNHSSEVNRDEDVMRLSIETLGLSTRSLNTLSRRNCASIGDVAMLSEHQIWCTRNLGIKAATEITDAIRRMGIRNTAWDKIAMRKSKCFDRIRRGDYQSPAGGY